jgi:hypothetical protein
MCEGAGYALYCVQCTRVGTVIKIALIVPSSRLQRLDHIRVLPSHRCLVLMYTCKWHPGESVSCIHAQQHKPASFHCTSAPNLVGNRMKASPCLT